MKPGAILASSSDVPTQATLMMKKKRESKSLVKGQTIEKIKVSKKALPRKPKLGKAEKLKLKAKKGKECQVRHGILYMVSFESSSLYLHAQIHVFV